MKDTCRRVFILSIIAWALGLQAGVCQRSIDLSGQWRFRMDRQNAGLTQQWSRQVLEGSVHLPGSLQAQGYGDDITAETEWYSGKLYGIWMTNPLYARYRKPGNVKIFEWLQPRKHYIGVAWYQRTFDIPAGWTHQRVLLYLERVHWTSMVWIDGRPAGSRRSLATAHAYDLGEALTPGRHTLTIRVDNAEAVNIGKIPHSVSDETQTAWNGIIGRIALQATPPVWVDDVQVYPDIPHKAAKVVVTVKNAARAGKKVILRLQASAEGSVPAPGIAPVIREGILDTGVTTFTFDYPMGRDVRLWSPFHPNLYRLSAILQGRGPDDQGRDTCNAVFGMRTFSADGTRFALNGQPIAIRGNVNCAVFPLTGYPRMDIGWWRKQWRIYKAWGLNTARFHSWCPPEAAFQAADEIGIYLEPEVDEWSHFKTLRQDSFFREESAFMLRCYGNHPSFVLMALGNELDADSTLLRNLIACWRNTDGRRLYTGKIAGNPVLDNFQFYNTGRLGKLPLRYHSGPQGGWPPKPGSSLFNLLPPETTLDYREAVAASSKPLITHELGQRCSYPDVLGEPAKYTGFLRATYLDIARDQLREHGMLGQVPDFVRASGQWQVQLYKEEIEANMRTPGIGGFNLLSLEDFPGQGTAPVGFLNVFYQNKGYVTPAAFRRFCSPQVLLARMPKRILELGDHLDADLRLYNFGEGQMRDVQVRCAITDAHGKTVWSRQFPARTYPIGNDLAIGSISLDLQTFQAPAKYNLTVSVPGTPVANDWDFWVYPHSAGAVDTSALVIARRFDTGVVEALHAGASVLLLPDTSTIRGNLPICFTDFYWTAFNLDGGTSSCAGLLCDPANPVFRYFPTEGYTDWQWWDLLTHAHPMILDDFTDPHPWPGTYRPLIQMIDSWKVNRKLGVLMEARVGKGKLLICSIDLEHDLDHRPATRQFRYSLLKYMHSAAFHPGTDISPAMIAQLFTSPQTDHP